MLEITIQKEFKVDFEDFLAEVNKIDVEPLIQKISDQYEDWDVDAIILNKIVSVMLSAGPESKDLKEVDTEILEKLLEIAKG